MSTNQPEAARQAIQAKLQQWTAAVRANDLDQIMAGYAPDVVAFDAIQTLRFQGVKAYREHWKFCLDMCGGMVFRVDELDIQASGDLAVAHALIHCGAGDESQSGYSRMTASYRLIDGQWLVTHEHFSLPFDMQTGRVLCDLKPEAAGQPAAVRAIPLGMNTLIPHLVCADASKAIDFYRDAFGASEESRLEMSPGLIGHACLRIAGSPFFLMDEAPQWGAVGPITLKGTPISMHLYVPDVDAAFEKAIAAGATAVMPVQDMFWGDRYGVVRDPFGHQWSLATHVRDLSKEEIERGAQAMKEQGCASQASAE